MRFYEWIGHGPVKNGLDFGSDLGPNFRNFSKTFSKALPMSDNLGIPKKFFFPNF